MLCIVIRANIYRFDLSATVWHLGSFWQASKSVM